MINFRRSEHVRPLPVVQIISLIDVLFVCLSFFMALSLRFNFESAMNIAVPKARAVGAPSSAAQELVINIQRDGVVFVNQKRLSIEELDVLLKRAAEINPGQVVILRADQKTFHGHVVRVLDVCADAKIWNVSFATIKEN